MPVTKRIICLANSRKLDGRCIGGVEVDENDPVSWIRPVSRRESQEVSEYERQYDDGSDPKLLDIIDIPLLTHQPDGCQQENWLLDREQYWTKVGVISWRDLERYAEPPASSDTEGGINVPASTRGKLWQNGYSTANGVNDRIPVAEAARESSSLKMIHVDSFELRVFAPSNAFGNAKRRVQGRFAFSGQQYAFWVTDPIIERRYLRQADGQHQLGECFLTISLGEPFHGFNYKLIAAVLEKPQ